MSETNISKTNIDYFGMNELNKAKTKAFSSSRDLIEEYLLGNPNYSGSVLNSEADFNKLINEETMNARVKLIQFLLVEQAKNNLLMNESGGELLTTIYEEAINYEIGQLALLKLIIKYSTIFYKNSVVMESAEEVLEEGLQKGGQGISAVYTLFMSFFKIVILCYLLSNNTLASSIPPDVSRVPTSQEENTQSKVIENYKPGVVTTVIKPSSEVLPTTLKEIEDMFMCSDIMSSHQEKYNGMTGVEYCKSKVPKYKEWSDKMKQQYDAQIVEDREFVVQLGDEDGFPKEQADNIYDVMKAISDEYYKESTDLRASLISRLNLDNFDDEVYEFTRYMKEERHETGTVNSNAYSGTKVYFNPNSGWSERQFKAENATETIPAGLLSYERLETEKEKTARLKPLMDRKEGEQKEELDKLRTVTDSYMNNNEDIPGIKAELQKAAALPVINMSLEKIQYPSGNFNIRVSVTMSGILSPELVDFYKTLDYYYDLNFNSTDYNRRVEQDTIKKGITNPQQSSILPYADYLKQPVDDMNKFKRGIIGMGGEKIVRVVKLVQDKNVDFTKQDIISNPEEFFKRLEGVHNTTKTAIQFLGDNWYNFYGTLDITPEDAVRQNTTGTGSLQFQNLIRARQGPAPPIQPTPAPSPKDSEGFFDSLATSFKSMIQPLDNAVASSGMNLDTDSSAMYQTATNRNIDLSAMYALTKEFISNNTDSGFKLEPEKYIVMFYDNYNKFVSKISPYESQIYIGFPLFIIIYFVRRAFKFKKMRGIARAEAKTAIDNQEKAQRVTNIAKNSVRLPVSLQKEKGIGFGFTPIVTEDNLLRVSNITRQNIQLNEGDIIAQIGNTTVNWPVVNYLWENEYKPLLDAVPDNGTINLIILRLNPAALPSSLAAVPPLSNPQIQPAPPLSNPQIQPTPEEIASNRVSEIKANPVNKENYDRRVNESDRIQVNLAKEASGRLGLTFEVTNEHILRISSINRQDDLIKEGDVIVKIGDIDVTWPVVNYYWEKVYRPILTSLPVGQTIILDILRLKPQVSSSLSEAQIVQQERPEVSSTIVAESIKPAETKNKQTEVSGILLKQKFDLVDDSYEWQPRWVYCHGSTFYQLENDKDPKLEGFGAKMSFVVLLKRSSVRKNIDTDPLAFIVSGQFKKKYESRVFKARDQEEYDKWMAYFDDNGFLVKEGGKRKQTKRHVKQNNKRIKISKKYTNKPVKRTRKQKKQIKKRKHTRRN